MKSLLKKAERTVRRFFILLIRVFFPASPVSPDQIREELQKGTLRNILFVGTSLKMGQFLCATPLFHAFKEASPAVSLRFLGNKTSNPTASSSPSLDRVDTWEPSLLYRPACLARFLRGLRRPKVDLAVLLTTEMPSTTGVLLARLSGARYLTGYTSDLSPLSSLYHLAIPYGNKTNETQKFLDLGRFLGLKPTAHLPEYSIKEEGQKWASSYLREHSMLKRPRVGLFLGGKVDRPERLWPVERFVALARDLHVQGIEWLAISPPTVSGDQDGFQAGEAKRLAEFLKEFKYLPVVFQDGDLGRVAAILKGLDLLVTPDGGIMHLSVAVGTPTLALFSETDPAVWYHPDPCQFFLKSPDKNPASLSAQEVIQKTKEILQTLPLKA